MTTLDSITARLDAVNAAREVSHDAACGGRYGIAYLLVDCRLTKGHDHDCATANAIRRGLPEIDHGLVEALRRIVALHQPEIAWAGDERETTFCGHCDRLVARNWPCPTLDALLAALDPGVGDGREVRGG